MLPDFERSLSKYAELAVKVGLNIRPGQRLMILAPIQAAPFVRLVTESAYKSGARLVNIIWGDDQVLLARFKYAPRDSFQEFPGWYAQALIEVSENKDAYMNVYAADPDLLQDQDPQLIRVFEKTRAEHIKAFKDEQVRLAFNWLIVSVPVSSWAAKVFPNVAPDQQEQKLWEAIFQVCRIDSPDPVHAWRTHVAQLQSWQEYLNGKQYSALRFTGPGTDLTIGLPEGHSWLSGRTRTPEGHPFVPNLPTEEVFTTPHKDKTEGVVKASKPLSYAGNLIEGFSTTFKRGRVVEVRAEKGEAVLRDLVETDEGAARLGEVSLVPNSSPISRLGLMFYNTLFDENAASHVALGNAYRVGLRGGEKLSAEEFALRGGNESLVHVDFMIGSGEIDVEGITRDGKQEPLMRAGEWAFRN